jgi:hypothetical protein
VRRQSDLASAMPAGSSCAQRLDPLALPLCFTASDSRADERLRVVELTRERVVVRRAVRGIRMAVNVPISAFLGIAVRLVRSHDNSSSLVSISLEHRDPSLSVLLYSAADNTDVVAEWQLWARVLGLPLLVADASGNLREPFRRIGAVRVGAPAPRRRRHNAIKARRPSILMRRRPGRPIDAPVTHREREIIARN